MNPKIKNLKSTVLSDHYYTLSRVTYEYLNRHGEWENQMRESYERGSGATVLLYNPDTGKIILIRQFRLPSYLNGNEDGVLIETCAGLLDDESPDKRVIMEAEEETGYRISNVKKIFEAYMSPGAVTEIIHYFIGRYDESMRVSEGGGIEDEQEDIEVLELNFEEAYGWIEQGVIKDAKTILLLQYAKINQLCDFQNRP